MQEEHQLVASHTPPTGDLAHNPGMCPDRESNWRPFSLRDDAQPTEQHQSGPMTFVVPVHSALVLRSSPRSRGREHTEARISGGGITGGAMLKAASHSDLNQNGPFRRWGPLLMCICRGQAGMARGVSRSEEALSSLTGKILWNGAAAVVSDFSFFNDRKNQNIYLYLCKLSLERHTRSSSH